jgi:hypothetical protein
VSPPARPERERRVRADVAADLEHDLCTVPERDRRRIATDPPAIDERVHGAGPGQQAVGAHRLAPDREGVAQTHVRPGELDDSAGLGRPGGRALEGAAG